MKRSTSMRKFNFVGNFFAMLISALLTGCVSIQIGSRPPVRSKDARYEAPPAPFTAKQSEHLDHLWLNSKNGNTISILSDCHNPADPSLDNLQRGMLKQIEQVSFLESRHVTFNDRDALHTLAEGRVDGVLSRMEFLLFKKHHCLYILTYLGVAENFGDDQRAFQKFIKGFHVP